MNDQQRQNFIINNKINLSDIRTPLQNSLYNKLTKKHYYIIATKTGKKKRKNMSLIKKCDDKKYSKYDR